MRKLNYLTELIDQNKINRLYDLVLNNYIYIIISSISIVISFSLIRNLIKKRFKL